MKNVCCDKVEQKSSCGDIDESVGGKILIFVDDTKIYDKIRYDEDIADFQSDLCNLGSAVMSRTLRPV